MSSKNFLPIGVLAAGVSLASQDLSADTHNLLVNSHQQVGSILMHCNPHQEQWTDGSSLTQIHVIQSWETMSRISVSYWFSLDNLERFLSMCPWYEDWNPDRIRAWEEILVLTPHGNNIMEELKERFITEEQRHIIEWYIAEWNYDIIKELYWYKLFSDTPTPLLWRWEEILGNMFRQNPRALWPRVVDWQYEYLTVCANLSRSWDRYMLADGSENSLQSMLLKPNINAWNFTEEYTRAWYEQLFDMREYFSRNVQKSVIPILHPHRDTYSWELTNLLRYLWESGVPWSKIPAFFLHTWASWAINSNPNFNPNSHVFSYVGNYTTDPFEARTFMPVRNRVIQSEWSEEISAIDYLIYTIQNLWWIPLALNPSMYGTIRNNLNIYGDEIVFIVDGKRVSVRDELENNSIRIWPESQIQIGGAIVMDGLKLATSDNPDEREKMNMRILPFWAVLSLDVFYPTEILERPEEINTTNTANTANTKIYNDLRSRLPMMSFIDVRRWETLLERYYQEISRQAFWKEFWELDEDEMQRVQEIYSIHSLAHQIMWYQSARWVRWNDGTTNINAPIPFYWVEDISLSSIRSIYFQYLTQKERDYISWLQRYNTIQEQREKIWEQSIKRLYIEVVVFGRAAPRQLLQQVEIQLDPVSRRYFSDLSSIQRETIAQRFFSPERLWKDHLSAWDTFIISSEEIRVYLELMRESTLWSHDLVDMYWAPSLDMQLIQATTSNPLTQSMLAHILANESYVNPCGDCSDFYRDFIWWLQTHFASRRGVKDLLHKIQMGWWDTIYNDLIDFIGQNTNILQELQELWITVPPVFPSINSMGDFQVRFQVLYGEGGRNIQEWWVLHTTLKSLLENTSNYSDIIETLRWQYPDIIASDMLLVEELMNEIEKETPSISTIQSILRSLLRLNDGTHSNIIWKIIELRVMEERVSMSLLDNIMAQYVRSWWNQGQDMGGKIWDFSNAVVLANNMWEIVQLTTFTENYIIRVIETLWEKYWLNWDITYPSIHSNRLNQIMYNTWTFRRHSADYQIILESFNWMTPEDKNLRDEVIALLWDITQSQGNSEYIDSIFRVHQSTVIQDFLIENWVSTSFFPTNEEIISENDIRQKIFRYINNRELVTQRIQKVPLTDKEKNIAIAPLYIAMILLLNRWAKMIWAWLVRWQWRDDYRNTKKEYKKQRKLLRQARKKMRLGIVVSNLEEIKQEYIKAKKKYSRIQSLDGFSSLAEKLILLPINKTSELAENTIHMWQRGLSFIQKQFKLTPRKFKKFSKKIDTTPQEAIDKYKQQQEYTRKIDARWNIIFWDIAGNYSDGYYKIWWTKENPEITQAKGYVLTNIERAISSIPYQDGIYSIHPPLSEIDKLRLSAYSKPNSFITLDLKIAAE